MIILVNFQNFPIHIMHKGESSPYPQYRPEEPPFRIGKLLEMELAVFHGRIWRARYVHLFHLPNLSSLTTYSKWRFNDPTGSEQLENTKKVTKLSHHPRKSLSNVGIYVFTKMFPWLWIGTKVIKRCQFNSLVKLYDPIISILMIRSGNPVVRLKILAEICLW